MPAKSEEQRKAAGAALQAKRKGNCNSLSPGAARQMCKTMSEAELEEFASGVANGASRTSNTTERNA